VTRARILVVAIAVLVIAGGLAWSLAGGGDDSGGAGSGDAVEVVLAASPEKEPLLAPLVEEINEGALESEGRPVRVDLRIVSSGDATDRIAEGELEPTIWSPSSSLWGRILNFRADREIVPDDAPSLVKTPLVIAMAEPLARALGWPDAEIGWEEIVAEARSEEGWAAYGHPEWGAFKFGQTNPQFSTSGLSATVAEYLVAAGKREGLTLADVERPANRAFVRDIQRSVVHYGDTTLFFAEQMAERGPQYVSAVAMEEVTLLDYNLRLRQGGPKLVAIYPKEGTFFSDNPLIVPQADWVDAERRAAAQVVREFLIERTTPEVAAESYFRPPGDAEPVPRPAAAPRDERDHQVVARRPKAGPGRDRPRRLRVDGRGGQARGGPERRVLLPAPAPAPGPGRALGLLGGGGAGVRAGPHPDRAPGADRACAGAVPRG
jgi:Ca-activated chloride channel family protein